MHLPWNRQRAEEAVSDDEYAAASEGDEQEEVADDEDTIRLMRSAAAALSWGDAGASSDMDLRDDEYNEQGNDDEDNDDDEDDSEDESDDEVRLASRRRPTRLNLDPSPSVSCTLVRTHGCPTACLSGRSSAQARELTLIGCTGHTTSSAFRTVSGSQF